MVTRHKQQNTTPEKPPRKPRVTVTDEQVAAALKAQRGNIVRTAEALDVDRSTVMRHIQDNPELQQVLIDAREALVDSAESALSKLIGEGNVAAIIFALKTQGKRRGWVERQEIVGADGEALKIEIVEVHADATSHG